uniref:Hexosyltransferase n=1 Tax=Brassica oleracea var. oleracea TaxID=109376 RepID=A0A0D3AAB6_BRAOL
MQFEEYSKMIYLDAGIQVYDNIDDLFDMEDGYLHGVLSCFCEKIWSYLPLYSIGWCQYRPEVTWPAEMESLPPPPYFNAGMFVFEPNPLTYESLLHTLQITPPTPFAEQDFLNMFFAKVFKPVPPVYNLILSVLWRHPGSVNLETVKVVHYCPPKTI